jgi:hypothetical protein
MSHADRVMLDDAVQNIPSEHNDLFTALLLSTRAIVRHDQAGLRNAVGGVFELQDRADEATRELMDAARQFRADGEALAMRLDEAIAASLADRTDLRHRLRRVEGHIIALWAAVLVLGAVAVLLGVVR